MDSGRGQTKALDELGENEACFRAAFTRHRKQLFALLIIDDYEPPTTSMATAPAELAPWGKRDVNGTAG